MAARAIVCRTCCSTWAGVPLVNHTARGKASISAISAASLRSWPFSNCRTCCGAPEDGGGTKNRVPCARPGAAAEPAVAPLADAVLPAEAAARVPEVVVAADAAAADAVMTAADTATAIDARRVTRLARMVRMSTPATLRRIL